MNTPAILSGKPVRKDFLPFARPFIGEEEKKEVLDTLNTDWLTIGPKTKRFEDLFCKYIGSKFAIATTTCTAALHCSLIVLGINDNDDVITTPLTYVSTVNVILYQNARPILVDIQKDTHNIDPVKIEEKISKDYSIDTKTNKLKNKHTGRTLKAIIPVHIAGHPCDMDEILQIAKKYNLFVIEDSAHAVGAEYKKQKIGTISDTSCFSFYPIKNMTAAQGGMLTTNDKSLEEKLRPLIVNGMSAGAWQRYSKDAKTMRWDVDEIGYNYCMTDIQASIGIPQLAKLDKFIETRELYSSIYNKEFLDCKEIIIPVKRGDIRHARHLYPIVLDIDRLKVDRNSFMDALKAENIGSGIHFRGIQYLSYYKNRLGFKPEDFPIASYISERTLSLPLYPKMVENDVYDVVSAVKKLIKYYLK